MSKKETENKVKAKLDWQLTTYDRFMNWLAIPALVIGSLYGLFELVIILFQIFSK